MKTTRQIIPLAGAAVWAGIAVLARMGIARVGAIELLFLFAPLVIVPLGMELSRVIGGAMRSTTWRAGCNRWARHLQLWLYGFPRERGPGRLLLGGWSCVCSWLGLEWWDSGALRGQTRAGAPAPHRL